MDGTIIRPRLVSTLLAGPEPAIDIVSRRFPRLTRSMRWAAILSTTEAGAALRDYIFGRDGVYDPELMRYGGGEAVCHFGGPRAVIDSAIAWRAAARKAWGVNR